MCRGDPKKLRGKMSLCAFFVQTCQEGNKHPDASVNFSEFSKKCSERWETMSAKEKGKFEDMAKVNKKRKRKLKFFLKGKQKSCSRIPVYPRPPSAFYLFCSEYHPKIREHLGLSIGDIAKKLGKMWNNTAADDKQPYKKAAQLKEKYEKHIVAYRAKGKLDVIKKKGGAVNTEKKQEEEEEDEENEDDDE